MDGSENNAFGDLALTSNTTGGTNTAVGDDALFSVTTGNSNTALGDEAGSNLIDGEGNIYIGAQVQAGDPTEAEFIRIGNDTAFTFPYDTFIAGIFNRDVDAGTAVAVFVDATGKLGTISSTPLETRGRPEPFPNTSSPKPLARDPKQAMLNRKVKELQATVARQQKQIDALNAGLQKVSAQLEASKPAPKVVANK